MENTSAGNPAPALKQKSLRWPVVSIILAGLSFLASVAYLVMRLSSITTYIRRTHNIKPFIPQFLSILVFLSCFLILLITRRKLRWLTILPLVFYILDNIKFRERASLYFAGFVTDIFTAFKKGRMIGIFAVIPLVWFVLLTIMMLILLIARKKALAIITSIFAGMTLLSELFVFAYVIVKGGRLPMLRSYAPWLISILLFYAVYIVVPLATLKIYRNKGQAVASAPAAPAPVAPAPVATVAAAPAEPVAAPVAEPETVAAQTPAPEAAPVPSADPAPAPVPEFIFCTHCGAKIMNGSKFCDQCGSPVELPLPVDPS